MAQSDKVNILLVDDQPSKLLSYEVILQSLGENLIKASSGSEALEHLLKHEVAVVLMDVCMPGLDGFELAAMIRDHPRCKNIAIIFISAIHLTDSDRLKGYGMGAVDYVPVPVIAEVLRAKVKIFTELYRKTRQLEEFNRDLERRVAERTAELESYATMLLESEKRRSLALSAGKMGAWDCDLTSGDCIWDEGHCQIFGVDSSTFKVSPEKLKSLLHPDDWERLSKLWVEWDADDASYETEFRIRRPNGDIRWCFGTAAASRDSDNRIVRLSGVTTDITERKQAAERQAFLAREVDHRARNVLAVVQSILKLTKASTIEAYLRAVEGRISALSRAHMLLSENRWQGADLGKLLDEELEPYSRGEAGVVVAAGPQLLLEPRYAQTIALAIHELATNAAKYGALSAPSGKITLSWSLGAQGLRIEWVEAEGPSISAPTVKGYGMKVIRSIEQLGGETLFDWRSEGLRCILSLPHAPTRKHSKSDDSATPKPRAVRLTQLIAGNSVLLVEDEAIVAMMMADALADLGFRVVGPCNSVDEALAVKAANHIDAAILDVNLRGALVYPLAESLVEEGIPLAFVTGYGAESIDSRFSHVPLLQKPINADDLRDLFVVSGKQPKVEPEGLVRAELR